MSSEPSVSRAGSRPLWKVERTLTDQLGDPLLEHDAALVTIAAAFGDAGCAQDLWNWLDDAARPLFSVAAGDLQARAAALAEVMTRALGLAAMADRYEGLLLDRAVARRSGHPLLLATVGHELARRAGWPSLVGHAAGHSATALVADGCFLPIFYGDVPEDFDPAKLRARCPHEVAFGLLAGIARHGPTDLAGSAGRVRDSLPVIDQREP
jgi:hypothetical protein